MTFSEQVQSIRIWRSISCDITADEIHKKLSIQRATTAEMMFIAELDQEYVDKADTNPPLKKPMFAFARLPEERRSEIIEKIGQYKQLKEGKYPTAPEFEQVVAMFALGLKVAPFDTAACLKCPHNTNCQTSLFADDGNAEDGTCMKPECYDEKTEQSRIEIIAKTIKDTEITLDNVTSYTGKQNILVDDIITLKEVSFKAWKPEELGDAQSGCQGCENRCALSQKQSTRFTASIRCKDVSCYETIQAATETPSQSDESAKTTSNTNHAEKGQGGETASTIATNNTATTATKTAKQVQTPEIGNCKHVQAKRRELLEAHVSSTVPSLTGPDLIKAILIIVSESRNISSPAHLLDIPSKKHKKLG